MVPSTNNRKSELELQSKIQRHFPHFKLNRFPERCRSMNFEKDILTAEQKLITQYGFMKEEINFIMRYKPTFILLDHQEDEGIHHIHKYFVEKKGFELDVVRSLVVKYPYIISKSEEHLDKYFSVLVSKGFTEADAMKQLLDCPKLISVNLEEQLKEICFLMNLYNGLTEEDAL